MSTPIEPHPQAAAVRSLAERDPRLAALIARVGPPPRRAVSSAAAATGRGGEGGAANARAHFAGLVEAIVSQQLSSKAAETIFRRVLALVPGAELPAPAAVLALPEERLRAAGLSGAKARYVRDLAARVHDGRLRLEALEALEDEAVIEALCETKGIGRWTAEMFLIFRLGRLDVLPVADLGIQKGFQALFGLRKRPDAARMTRLARPFRPYRSLVCWYLWRLGELPADEVKRLLQLAVPAGAGSL